MCIKKITGRHKKTEKKVITIGKMTKINNKKIRIHRNNLILAYFNNILSLSLSAKPKHIDIGFL